jgi:hypothetical protein
MNLVRTTSSTATRSTRSPNTIGDAKDDAGRHLPPACGRRRRPGGGEVHKTAPSAAALREAVRRDGRVRHGGGLQVPTTWIFLRPGRQGAESRVSPADRTATRSPFWRRPERCVPRGDVLEPETASTWMIRRRVGLRRCTPPP